MRIPPGFLCSAHKGTGTFFPWSLPIFVASLGIIICPCPLSCPAQEQRCVWECVPQPCPLLLPPNASNCCFCGGPLHVHIYREPSETAGFSLYLTKPRQPYDTMSWVKMVAAVLGRSSNFGGTQDSWDPWELAILMCKERLAESHLLPSENACVWCSLHGSEEQLLPQS